jgi:hypothetical protein
MLQIRAVLSPDLIDENPIIRTTATTKYRKKPACPYPEARNCPFGLHSQQNTSA